jgi:hypothetical protein
VVSGSSTANRYGTAAERAAADRYRLRREGNHTSWCDALDADGVPHEIKSTVHRRASGRPGRFRLWKDQHDRLAAAGGRYVFVVYRIRGRGVQPLKMTRIRASRLPISTWYGGSHPKGKERKITPASIF